jgi:hypothetical protein
MLLDARVKLSSMIKIDNSLIQGQLISIDPQMKEKKDQMASQNQVYDRDDQFYKGGQYEVLSITHSGDTWGDDWSTEVVGIGRNGRAGLQTAIAKPEQTLQ